MFLYGYLIDLYLHRGHNVYVYYDKSSSKITSVKKNKHVLKELAGCSVIPYLKQDDCMRRIESDVIDIIMTNEGMPFEIPAKLPCKMYAFSWTIEHVVHGPRFMPICDVFFCDDTIVKKIHDLSNYKNMKVDYDCHPKYLCLNKSRQELCCMLGLDPKQKYVTVMGPAPALNYKPRQKDIKKLVKFFANRGYKIIYKYKPKDKVVKICHYDVKMSHAIAKYSTSAILSFISEVVIGFNTSGIIESVHTQTPFINFFLKHNKVNYRQHWQFRINTDFILRLDSFDKQRVKEFIKSNKSLPKRTVYPLGQELDI